jgi:hypothetical protein
MLPLGTVRGEFPGRVGALRPVLFFSLYIFTGCTVSWRSRATQTFDTGSRPASCSIDVRGFRQLRLGVLLGRRCSLLVCRIDAIPFRSSAGHVVPSGPI